MEMTQIGLRAPVRRLICTLVSRALMQSCFFSNLTGEYTVAKVVLIFLSCLSFVVYKRGITNKNDTFNSDSIL